MKQKSTPEHPIVTAWVVKYALTSGIQKVTGKYSSGEAGEHRMLVYRTDKSTFNMYAHRNEFFLTEAEAIEHVKGMVERKLKSLAKQVEKYTNYTIKVVEA